MPLTTAVPNFNQLRMIALLTMLAMSRTGTVCAGSGFISTTGQLFRSGSYSHVYKAPTASSICSKRDVQSVPEGPRQHYECPNTQHGEADTDSKDWYSLSQNERKVWLSNRIKRLQRRLGTLNKRLREITELEAQQPANYEGFTEGQKLKLSRKMLVKTEIKVSMRSLEKYKKTLHAVENGVKNFGASKSFGTSSRAAISAPTNYYTENEFDKLLNGGLQTYLKVVASTPENASSQPLKMFIAGSYGSKETAMFMIENRLVTVNDEKVTNPLLMVHPLKDDIKVLDETLNPTGREMFMRKRLSKEQHDRLRRQRIYEFSNMYKNLHDSRKAYGASTM